jgi:uncharacterized protein (DUF433 family)
VPGFSTRPPHHGRVTFDRITVDPDLMGGVPTIRGLRIPVATVVSMVAGGYAAEPVRERRLPLRPSA